MVNSSRHSLSPGRSDLAPEILSTKIWLFRVSSALELNASKGYHANMINNRRVHYGRITYPFRHSKPGNNIASH